MKSINFEKKDIFLLYHMLDTFPSSPDVVRLKNKFKNAEKQIKPSSAKAKGRELQYLVCKKIADKFGVEYNQLDDNCLIHSREMGQHGTDIILRGKVKELLPIDIECKNQENLSLIQWIEQAKNNSISGNWAVVVKNKKLKNPIVCLDFDIFLNFIL